jgi:hypothetical protein
MAPKARVAARFFRVPFRGRDYFVMLSTFWAALLAASEVFCAAEFTSAAALSAVELPELLAF